MSRLETVRTGDIILNIYNLQSASNLTLKTIFSLSTSLHLQIPFNLKKVDWTKLEILQRTPWVVTVRWNGTRPGTRQSTTRITWRTSPAEGRTARSTWWRTSVWRRCTARTLTLTNLTTPTWRPLVPLFTLSGKTQSTHSQPSTHGTTF